MKRILKVFACFPLFFILFQIPVVMSLGISHKGTYAEVKKGETAQFTILLWNSENSSLPVSLRVRKAPEDTIVIIRPEELLLNYSKVTKFPAEKGKDYSHTPRGLMEMVPVKVLVKTTDRTAYGEHDVQVDVVAGRGGSGIKTLLENTLKFTVNVKAPTTSTTSSTTTIKTEEESIGKRVTGMLTKAPIDLRLVFSLLLIVGIFVVFSIIYKYA